MFNFDEPIQRKHTDSLKWAKYAQHDIIPLWVADTDFKSPPSIINALQTRINHGVFGYGGDNKRLTDTFIQWAKTQYNWQVAPDWLTFLPGLVCGLNLALRAYTTANETSICPFPIYPPFMGAAKHINRTQLHAPLIKKANRWVMNLEATTAPLQGNEKLLMLCNPQNPGGTVYTHEELMKQLSFAQQHNLVVCSDEIHCDLILEKGLSHIPFASLNNDAAERSITLMAPSKTFNIAGLGASIAIIPNPTLRQQFRETLAGIVPELNILAYPAAIAAYSDTSGWLQSQLDYLRANRDLVFTKINQIKGLSVLPIEASYLAWIDATLLPVENPQTFFEQAGVGLSPGKDFGNDRFVRLNFGCNRSLLEEALKRIEKACATLA